eukprot:8570376-Pyramimonas_sp.AAC.1
MRTAEELAFDPQEYLDNLYKLTSKECCPTTLYGDIPASQPLTGILRPKDQDPTAPSCDSPS